MKEHLKFQLDPSREKICWKITFNGIKAFAGWGGRKKGLLIGGKLNRDNGPTQGHLYHLYSSFLSRVKKNWVAIGGNRIQIVWVQGKDADNYTTTTTLIGGEFKKSDCGGYGVNGH